MKRTIVLVMGLLFAGVFASNALAADPAPRTGYIEVCKQTAGSPAATGSFRFTINDAPSTRPAP